MKSIFLASKYAEADYWRRAWGFAHNEWAYARNWMSVLGLRAAPGDCVFACGSGRIDTDLVDYLETQGFTNIVDAHDLDTFYEPRSALLHLDSL